MERDWVKIFDYPDEVKCEMARQILADESIESVVINKKDRMYGFGDYELYVLRDNVILAKRILKELNP
jgi:chaperonin GroEL (HSP60 family)